jgi:pimeloyl-ACP methyl ester carboxylesterase
MTDEGDACVGDALVHWRREGSGPVIVLLHGFPLSGRTWQPVVQLLRDRYTCVMPDLIGLGGSRSASDDDHTSEGQARAIRGVLRSLGIERYVLAGNDTGGWVARELALIDRERVSHLVLTNTEIPGHRPPWIPTYQALAHVPGSGTLFRRVMRSRTFLDSGCGFGGCFHDRQRISGEFREHYVVPLLTSDAAMAGVLRFLRCMKFRRLDEFRSLHRDMTMPTLFVWGADDPTFPEWLARGMAAQFPNVVGFHSVRDAKLFFHEEHPRVLASLLARVVQRPA